jgi:5-bromo-4-chloroindolyl phosphate hydrolysis protein
MVGCHSMKGRILPVAVILTALLVSFFVAEMLVVPSGLKGQAHAQTATGVAGNLTEEDLSIIRESLNDARRALFANDTLEATDELDFAQSIITLPNQSQAETQTPQVEGNATTTITENQTDAQNLTEEDLDTIQQSLNSVRDAIHANDSGVATDELTTAYEELSRIENETLG